jgi:hypothetical protein
MQDGAEEVQTMPTVSATTVKTALTFPTDAVAKALRDELITAVRAEAKRKAQPIPAKPDKLVGASIEIDSLAVVEILCVLDDILPFQADERVVRAGGYGSIKTAVDHVVGRVKHEWIKHHNGGKS